MHDDPAYLQREFNIVLHKGCCMLLFDAAHYDWLGLHIGRCMLLFNAAYRKCVRQLRRFLVCVICFCWNVQWELRNTAKMTQARLRQYDVVTSMSKRDVQAVHSLCMKSASPVCRSTSSVICVSLLWETILNFGLVGLQWAFAERERYYLRQYSNLMFDCVKSLKASFSIFCQKEQWGRCKADALQGNIVQVDWRMQANGRQRH